MKKTLIGVMGFLLVASCTAWAQEAIQLYNLGLKSSMAYKKIHYFTQALELDPELSEAYEKRGMLYYFQGKYNQTIHDFKKVAELTPFASEPYHMLGLAYIKLENVDEAIVNLTQAIKLDPTNSTAYSYRSEAYFKKGMIEEAIRDSGKAIELGGRGPIIGKAYSIRSKAYRKLGQSQLAEADFNKALKLDPDYYVYTFATSTELLASWAGESGQLKRVSWMGAALIIAIFFVVIFKLAFPPPKKDE